MDPLSALSLGSNILQIISFGVELIGVTRDVIQSGDLYDYHHLHRISSNLRDLVDGLPQAEPHGGDASFASADKPTEALTSLAQEAKIEAEAMIAKLENNRPRENARGKTSRRSALKTATLAIWSRSETEAMAVRLDRYRNQLALHMLELLNARSTRQGNSIVEILSLTQKVNSSVQVIAALLKNLDGSMDTILSDVRPSGTGFLTNASSVTYENRGISSESQDSSDTSKHYAAVTEIPFSKVAQKVIDSLWFAFFNSRQKMVEDPFGKTLDWITGTQSVEDAEWDNFPEWLRTGTGCYWISGKAGSGKSTLMKYIAGHFALTQNLHVWKGDDNLLKGSFFLWRAGIDPLQKSQEGLLRSLLLQILDNRRELVAICFPALCHRLSYERWFKQELKISFEELIAAFSLLVKSDLPKTKIFLLIDGLDEYQGDHRDLITVLSPAMNSRMTKLLVSSRPTPLLFQAFSKCSGLQVHNLTKGDIRHYAEEKLYSDGTLLTMERLKAGVSRQLIENVVSKASGVFLWVVIVVRDLLYGLAHHDTLETLMQNVDKLPTDLEQLYDYMFKSMSPSYRREASHMMRLFKRSQEIQFEVPMTAIQLAFADEIGDVPTKEIPHKVFSVDEEKAHCELVEGRLRSRCCGLLEVQKSHWGLDDDRVYVGFLHRTVLDYIQRDEIHTQLLSWDSAAINIDTILFSTCVMEIRQRAQTSGTEGASARNVPPMSREQARETGMRILHAISYYSNSPEDDRQMYKDVVAEMTQTFLALPEAVHQVINEKALSRAQHPSVLELAYTFTDKSQGFWMFAALHGIGFPVRGFSAVGFRDAQSSSLALFNNLMHLSHPHSDSVSAGTELGVDQLLTAGANPNEPCLFFGPPETVNAASIILAAICRSPKRDNSLVPWILWLSCKEKHSPIINRDYLLYMRILGYMMNAGASCEEFLGSEDPRSKKHIYEVVEECIEAIPTTSKEAVDLRNHIRAMLRDNMAKSSARKNTRSWTRAKHSLKIPLRLTRSKASNTP